MKTRFSPSPTGQMHLGNVRTALFNALLARHAQGEFLLRIEDTDRTRSQDEFTQLLQEDLHWLDLDWTEGPYFQSQRQAIYDQYYAQLIQSQHVYPCFCSDEQLALSRKVQLSSGQPPRYSGTCRQLTAAQIAEKEQAGLKPTLRFKVPQQQAIDFVDLVKGTQHFSSDDIGDFIIRRADGTASFFFCNAIDDALMGVTHAIRGEDHLTNTPRQMLLLQALNLPVPQYGHLPLIVGPDGSPLSKRHGSRSVQALREAGYLPIALNNYLARVGHYYTQIHLMPMAELAANFSVEHIGNTPAHYDEQQLRHWQKIAVSQLSDAEFWQWIGDAAQKIPAEKRELFIHTIRPNCLFPEDAAHWAEILFGNFVLNEQAKTILQQASAEFFTHAIRAVQNNGVSYSLVINELQQQLNVKGKGLFQPLRAALTGELHGPELHSIFELLGAEKIIERLIQC